MKPYHEELSSKAWSMLEHRVPKNISFESFKYLLDFFLAASCWQVLESIHKFIIELHSLKCLFGRESNKRKKRGWVISNFTKGQTFLSPMATKWSWRQSHNAALLLAHYDQGLSLLSSLAKKKKFLDTQFNGKPTDLFWK